MEIDYIYFESLRFLEKSVYDKITNTNIENIEPIDVEFDYSDADADIIRQTSNQSKKKTGKISAVDKEFLNILQKNMTENDPDKLFYLSLYKKLVKISKDFCFKIKMELMNVIQKLLLNYSTNATLSNTAIVAIMV